MNWTCSGWRDGLVIQSMWGYYRDLVFSSQHPRGYQQTVLGDPTLYSGLVEQ